jgi:hypothetical protein
MRGLLGKLLVILVGLHGLDRQTTFPVQGIPDVRSHWYVFKNATLHLDADRVVESALVIKEGRIVALVSNDTKVEGAVNVDLSGMHIYPSFVDLFSDYGLSAPDQSEDASSSERGSNRSRSPESGRSGAYHWNDALKSDFNAYTAFEPSDKEAQPIVKLALALRYLIKWMASHVAPPRW